MAQPLMNQSAAHAIAENIFAQILWKNSLTCKKNLTSPSPPNYQLVAVLVHLRIHAL